MNAARAASVSIMTARSSSRNPIVDQIAGGRPARAMVLVVDAATSTVSDVSHFTTGSQ